MPLQYLPRAELDAGAKRNVLLPRASPKPSLVAFLVPASFRWEEAAPRLPLGRPLAVLTESNITPAVGITGYRADKKVIYRLMSLQLRRSGPMQPFGWDVWCLTVLLEIDAGRGLGMW